MDFHIVKMYKDKEVNKNVKNICLSMCDVRVFLTFTSLNLVLLWQLFYLFCSSIVINTVIVTTWTFDIVHNISPITMSVYITSLVLQCLFYTKLSIRVITKLPNSEQSYKGKVKTHKYINTKSVNNWKTCNTRDVV
jgi:hypothetical protein